MNPTNTPTPEQLAAANALNLAAFAGIAATHSVTRAQVDSFLQALDDAVASGNLGAVPNHFLLDHPVGSSVGTLVRRLVPELRAVANANLANVVGA